MLLALSLPSIPTDGASLSVVTFGDFLVTVDEAEVENNSWESANAKWLLAYLLCQQKPVAERDLAELFWPGSPQEKAHRCLLSTVHRLRKALGRSEIILRRNGQYALAPEVSLDFDVLLFNQSFERGKKLLKRGEKARALPHFRKMRKAYGGAFLRECDHAWCASLREQFEDRLVVSLSLGANCHLPTEIAQAEELCHQGLSLNPGAEALWWTLMQCRYLDGDPAGVKAVYARARETIRAQTGAPPSPLLSSLFERMHL